MLEWVIVCCDFILFVFENGNNQQNWLGDTGFCLLGKKSVRSFSYGRSPDLPLGPSFLNFPGVIPTLRLNSMVK